MRKDPAMLETPPTLHEVSTSLEASLLAALTCEYGLSDVRLTLVGEGIHTTCSVEAVTPGGSPPAAAS
jgi:hypothetical protein